MEAQEGAASLARRLAGWTDTDARGEADRGSLHSALARRTRALLLDGRLAAGVRVPSERELAGALGVGRGTVAAAYERLRETGHLVRRRGSGSWTAIPTADAAPGPFTPGGPGLGDSIDLAHAAPRAPGEALARAGAAAVEALPRHLAGSGYDMLGIPPLREAVARHLSADGLPTDPDEIMVTCGAQHAHALVARALVRPGDRMLLDQPTYPNAIGLAHDSSARAVPVALLDGGGDGAPVEWDVRGLAAAVRESSPALGYLVADHHNPTGAVMAPQDREAVVEVFRRHGVPLVVDDCLRELWLERPPPAPLGSHAGARSTSSPVITVGSLDKTVWGGLRTGWLRAPRSLLARIATTRASDDVAPAVFSQLVAVSLLEHAGELAEATRARIRDGCDHLTRALSRTLPEWRLNRPPGGMSLWADLGAPRSSVLVEAAARHRLALAAGPRFGVGGAFESRLRVPYTAAPDVLDDAVARLAAAWAEVDRAPSPLTTVV